MKPLRERMRIPHLKHTSVLALFLCLNTLFMTSCFGAGKPAWQFCPIGGQFHYGNRSEPSPNIGSVFEESTGGLFLDNRQDVFVEDQLCVNNSSYKVPKHLEDALFNTMAEYKFDTSFYVIDLETHASFAYNPTAVYDCASTIKVAFALYVAREIDSGRLSLADIITYERRHWASGSGSTQYSVYGTKFTVKAIYYRMIYNSDNVAYYMLCEYAGIDGFNEMLKSLGWEHTISEERRWCDLTAQELAIIWQEVWDYKDKTETGKLLWTYLTTNLYNELQEEMPEYPSAHKSGWSTQGYHESGIVMGNRDYICVVLTGTGDQNNCLHRTIRNLDNVINDYDTWLEKQTSK